MTREQKLFKAWDTEVVINTLNEYLNQLLDFRTDEEKEGATYNRLNSLVSDLQSELESR